MIQSQTIRILYFFLRIFDEFFSGFRAKFQQIVTFVAFSIKFAETNRKFAENSESKFVKKIHYFAVFQHFLNLQEYLLLTEILKLLTLAKFKISEISFCNIRNMVAEFLRKLLNLQTEFLLKCWVWSDAEVCTSCRDWKMLSHAYFLAKFKFSYVIFT